MLKKDKIYRKEDIDQMSFKGVNKSLGHNGKRYSLFKFSGGVYCHHTFERRLYQKRLNAEGKPWGGSALVGTNKISVADAVRKGFKLPKQKAGRAPILTPDRGKF